MKKQLYDQLVSKQFLSEIKLKEKDEIAVQEILQINAELKKKLDKIGNKLNKMKLN